MGWIMKIFLSSLAIAVAVVWVSKYELLLSDYAPPYYQCEISIDYSKADCKDEPATWHMCQIYDHSFNGDYVPNVCYKWCLPRSGANPNCANVTVNETTNFAAHDRPEAKYIWLYHSVLYDGITFWDSADEVKEENNDINECQFDSDCKDYCDWDTIVDMYCDNSNYSCKQWKTTQCGSQTEIFAWTNFTKTCNKNLECEINKKLLEEENQKIATDLKKYNEALATTSTLRQKFQNECEKWVILVSTKLITDSSILILTYSTSLLDLIFDTAWKLIEEWLNQITSDPSKMSPDEYVVWACSSRDYLINQEELFHKKISDLVEASKTYRNKVSTLTNQ